MRVARSRRPRSLAGPLLPPPPPPGSTPWSSKRWRRPAALRFVDQLRPDRAPAPAGDHGGRRGPARLRRRRLARRLRGERRALARPREDGARALEPPLPQPRRRPLQGRHREAPGWPAAATTSASSPATTTTTATPTSSWPACAGTRCSATTATAPSRTSRRRPASRPRPEVRHALGGGRRLRGLRPRRAAGPLRLQLLRVGPGPGAAVRQPRGSRLLPPAGSTRAFPTRCSATTATAPSPTCPPRRGSAAHVGKGMGIGVADFDDDGFTDLFVANDTVPSFLFMNNRNGTFTESAFERAVAFTERAEAVSGMGADAARRGQRRPARRLRDRAGERDVPPVQEPGRRGVRGGDDALGRGARSRARAPGGATASSTSTTTAGRTCSWPART